MKLRYSLRLRVGYRKCFFGPGVEQLLWLVNETGSLQTASVQINMSYSKAWKIIKRAERDLGFKLMERHVGGSGGGFSKLTAKGLEFVNQYTSFRQELCVCADQLFEKYFDVGDINEKN